MIAMTMLCEFVLFGILLVAALPDDKITGTGAFFLSDHDPSILKRCRYEKFQRMLQARCTDLNLKEIPRNLQKDVQILDFSGNRLRELGNDTLKPFTSLAYLYFVDNFIQHIGVMTFSNAKNLQVLDLTQNGLKDFPKNILTLPQLKKLYLGGNVLTDAALSIDILDEESNIEVLELSRNELTKIPQLSSMSQLKYLNVSGNGITRLEARDIALYCSLEVLDITHNPIKFHDVCECNEFISWIALRKIKLFPADIKCHNARSRRDQTLTTKCSVIIDDKSFSNETLQVYGNCKETLKHREETVKARTTWIIVCTCVGVFLVALFIILYCIHKHNKKRKLKSIKKDLGTTNNHNAAEELLNDNK